MSLIKKSTAFWESPAGTQIKATLLEMSTDIRYNTNSSYSANTDTYPDNLIPFVDKHMNYLTTHPSTDPDHYIANLRLMTRVR